MSRLKVDLTGVNTSNIKVLSNEEMLSLFDKYKKGDLNARNDIVNGNLKLVLSILKSFSNSDENKDDLFQIGCVGLLKAVDNFDSSYGVKFSTYCVPMVQGEIRRYVRDNSNSIRVSRSLKDLSSRVIKARENMAVILGRNPTVEEISKELDVDSYDIMLSLESRKTPLSIFEPIYNDGGDTIYLCDQIEDKKSNGDEFELKIAVLNAIKDLNEREQYIVDQRFVIGKTQMELSKELSISQAQISRIEKKAIESIKKKLK